VSCVVWVRHCLIRGFIPPFKYAPPLSGAPRRGFGSPPPPPPRPSHPIPSFPLASLFPTQAPTSPTHLLPSLPSPSPVWSGRVACCSVHKLVPRRRGSAMAAAADVDEVAAADIICSLRGADLAGWTPPWRRAETEPSPAPAARREGEMVWPAVARGKRSRRRSPSAGSAATGKGRWGRGSPASPLDYSGGSGSGSAASTSGGEDGGGFCSPGDRRAPANKVRGSVSLFLSRCKSLCRRRRAALGSSPSPTTSTLSLSYPLFSFPVFFCPFPFFLG
jgi:hypothetical protein